MTSRFYVTTPIYYVNDRPHIGHVYTTTLADILARFHRLLGEEVFFLTGTDEHAAKVVDSAAQHGLSAQEWADRNAAAFQVTFVKLGMTHDDFIRTSQDRHKTRVVDYIQRLQATGDVYQGEYSGWYDPSQEEYVPENKAKEYDFKSPVTGRPLVRKTEKNYFFRLSRFQDRLEKLLTTDQPDLVQPEARRNEVLGRLREGLNDVPISRSGTGGWGIAMPGDDQQTIYVWIDALFNYLSTIDTPDRRAFWSQDCRPVHLIAKDILWFHAVIWPAMLMALDHPLPRQIYSHSFWIAEGRKMSKSLGNFIDLEKIDQYVATFGLDALRWFLATQGPLGATDADFSHKKFIEVYNTDLANTLGNCSSRVTNMTSRYFEGRLPPPGPAVPDHTLPESEISGRIERYLGAMRRGALQEGAEAAIGLIRQIDGFIEATQPFKLAKQPDQLSAVGTILHRCAEALRVASLMLWPFLPGKTAKLLRQMGCGDCADSLEKTGSGRFAEWVSAGRLKPGTPVEKGEPLFPRYQEPAPA